MELVTSAILKAIERYRKDTDQTLTRTGDILIRLRPFRDPNYFGVEAIGISTGIGIFSTSEESLIIPFGYRDIQHLHGEFFRVTLEKKDAEGCFYGTKEGIYSIKQGKLVVPAEYYSVSYETDNYFAVEPEERKRTLFSVESQSIVLPEGWQSLYDQWDSEKPHHIRAQNGDREDLFSVAQGKLMGYDGIRFFPDRNYCAVRKDGKWGAMRFEDERLVVPIEYDEIIWPNRQKDQGEYFIVVTPDDRRLFSIEDQKATRWLGRRVAG